MGSVGFFGGRRPPPKNENEFSRFLLEKQSSGGFFGGRRPPEKEKSKNIRIFEYFFACGALVRVTSTANQYQTYRIKNNRFQFLKTYGTNTKTYGTLWKLLKSTEMHLKILEM